MDLTPGEQIADTSYRRWLYSANRNAYVAAVMREIGREGYRAGREDAARGRRVVYVTATPTPWQAATEAIYGPFSDEEADRFSEWAVRQENVLRVASFPLAASPGQVDQPWTVSQGERGDNPEKRAERDALIAMQDWDAAERNP